MNITPTSGSNADLFAVRNEGSAKPATQSTAPAAQSIVASEQKSTAVSVNPAELSQAVKAINEFLKPLSRNLVFSVDEESNHKIVKVVDADTKEVVRQMPSEEALAIAKALDRFQGLLVREKA